MAASQVKILLDELAAVLGQIGAMDDGATDAMEPAAEGDAPAADGEAVMENSQKLEGLLKRAETLKAQIEFFKRAGEREKELRAVLERAAPETKTEPKAEERAVFAIPKSNSVLKAFRGPNADERAYRAGMHLRATLLGDAESKRWCMDHGMEFRIGAGGINSLGGALVSSEMSTEIIRLVEEYGAFPANAKSQPMSSDTMVVARRTGGLTARPVGENVETTASDVLFDNVELVAKIWGVANRVSNSLLEDSVINLADAMAVEVAQAYAEAFDNAGFIGDGSSTYHGVTGVAVKINDGTRTKSVVTALSGNVGFDTLDLLDFTNCVSRLPLYARRNAKFYISPAGYGSSMLRLAMASSSVSPSDVAGGFGLQFLGFPVVLCHPMQSALTGTTSSIVALFGDLSLAATYGDRRAVSIKTASERYIEYDQTLTFATARVAINVHDLGSTTVAGPIVALKTAAS